MSFWKPLSNAFLSLFIHLIDALAFCFVFFFIYFLVYYLVHIVEIFGVSAMFNSPICLHTPSSDFPFWWWLAFGWYANNLKHRTSEPTFFWVVLFIDFHWYAFPAGNHMLKDNNRNTRTMCVIFSKLTVKTPERRLLLTLNKHFLKQNF